MLKLPSGWALVLSGSSSASARASSGPSSLRSAAGVVTTFRRSARAEPGERTLRGLGVQGVEIRVRREAAPQVFPGLVGMAESMMDHSRVEIEPGIASVELQGLLDFRERLARLPIFQQRPRQDVVGIDVVSHLELFARQVDSDRRLEIVVRIEEGKLAVVHRLVQRAEL